MRLSQEIQNTAKSYFVTLTFSEESFDRLCEDFNTKMANEIATKATRLFLERWRKVHKRSLRHWFITELGHEGTERVHLHGIVFTNENFTNEILSDFWKYGRTDVGKYCNQRTINYIVKYVTKIDNDHKGYKPTILCSAGLGKRYLTDLQKEIHAYAPGRTQEYIKLPNGGKCNLPIYYRNNLWTDEERERLWIERLDKHERYVNGILVRHIDTEEGQKELDRVLKAQQEINRELGFGDNGQEWQRKEYFVSLCKLNKTKASLNEENHNTN